MLGLLGDVEFLLFFLFRIVVVGGAIVSTLEVSSGRILVTSICGRVRGKCVVFLVPVNSRAGRVACDCSVSALGEGIAYSELKRGICDDSRQGGYLGDFQFGATSRFGGGRGGD